MGRNHSGCSGATNSWPQESRHGCLLQCLLMNSALNTYTWTSMGNTTMMCMHKKNGGTCTHVVIFSFWWGMLDIGYCWTTIQVRFFFSSNCGSGTRGCYVRLPDYQLGCSALIWKSGGLSSTLRHDDSDICHCTECQIFGLWLVADFTANHNPDHC